METRSGAKWNIIKPTAHIFGVGAYYATSRGTPRPEGLIAMSEGCPVSTSGTNRRSLYLGNRWSYTVVNGVYRHALTSCWNVICQTGSDVATNRKSPCFGNHTGQTVEISVMSKMTFFRVTPARTKFHRGVRRHFRHQTEVAIFP